MKQKKENSMALLLHWAGEQKFWYMRELVRDKGRLEDIVDL